MVDTTTHLNDVKTTLQNDPRFAGMNIDALVNAYDTGDFSGVTNSVGQPLSTDAANKALSDSMAVLDPLYAAEKAKATADLQDTLGNKQAQYNSDLATSGANFQADKTALDKSAADQGVLFSGGRYQKENNLSTRYANADAARKASLTSDVNTAGRDFAYKYGSTAAQNPNLSSYYQAGGNTYNANVATGGVGSSGLSTLYNPGATNFYGTNNAAESAAAKTRAAGLLANQANKLVSGNYNNKI